MTVFVVQRGWHSNRMLAGIYSSLGAAQAAHPQTGPDGWTVDAYGWSNGLTWDDFCDIKEYTVED